MINVNQKRWRTDYGTLGCSSTDTFPCRKLHIKNYSLFFSFKKSRQRFSTFPDMPFWVSLKMISLYRTFSNDVEISRNTLLTSRPLSKQLYISWIIDNSWFRQESSDLKPDWMVEISLFWVSLFTRVIVVASSN